MHSYGVGKHRHMPEIEQGLAEAAGKDVTVSFTPHLIPMNRGMQSTMYVQLAEGQSADTLRDALSKYYADEYFVRVLPKGSVPHTRHVRASNFNLINVFEDRISGRAIVISVIDNLCKGASGQAIQNLNVMMGCDEKTAIGVMPVFPQRTVCSCRVPRHGFMSHVCGSTMPFDLSQSLGRSRQNDYAHLVSMPCTLWVQSVMRLSRCSAGYVLSHTGAATCGEQTALDALSYIFELN
eukprot:TRINITY_DN21081_c2_g1_i1.p1 TRINITY_DN21081_c2_g1~~TRINITY_DN21081_c2_g1_i1.p1  ORF type:complete len:268 (+),score=19.00 TRINITY_DN21081_c2_g1_i1:96-806(+)